MIAEIIKIVYFIPIAIILYQFFQTIWLALKYKMKYGSDVAIKIFPFIGQIYYMKKSLRQYGDEYYFLKVLQQENPKIKGLLVLSGILNTFYIFDNDWVRLYSQDSHLFTKGDNAFNFKFFFSLSMFFCPQKVWKRQRLFLNSNFHFDSLKSKVEIIKNTIKSFGEELPLSKDKFLKVNLAQEVQKLTSQVIIQSFFGESFRGVKVLNQDFCKVLGDMINESFHHSLTSPYFLIKKSILGNDLASKTFLTKTEKQIILKQTHLYQYVEQTIDRLIKECEQKYEDVNDMQLSNRFLDLYIKEYLVQQKNKGIVEYKEEDIVTKKEMIHQFFNFFLAGMDTTANLVSLTIYELARNKDIYDRLIQEINQVVPNFDEMQHSDLAKLPYLDMVLKETLRLYPPTISIFPRYAEKNYQKEDLYIEKNLYTMHKLIQYTGQGSVLFDEPFSYKPERFKSGNTYNPFDYIPFSTGPRNCIGQHLGMIQGKFIMTFILKNYNFLSVPGYELIRTQKFMYLPQDQELIQIQPK